MGAGGIPTDGFEEKFSVDLNDREKVVELVGDEAGGLVRLFEVASSRREIRLRGLPFVLASRACGFLQNSFLVSTGARANKRSKITCQPAGQATAAARARCPMGMSLAVPRAPNVPAFRGVREHGYHRGERSRRIVWVGRRENSGSRVPSPADK